MNKRLEIKFKHKALAGYKIMGMRKYLFFFWGSISVFSLKAQWNQEPDALKARSETVSVVYNGKLYTFLGFADSNLNPESSVEVYDPVSNTWQLLKSIDPTKSMTHQGVVLQDDNVWHIGGRVGQNPGPITHETWIYNIASDTWIKGPNIIDPSNGANLKWAGGGAALLGRTIHIFGGFVNTACNGDQSQFHLTLDVDAYFKDPASVTWENKLAPMPVPRNHLSSVVMGGKIYALGGQFGHDCSGGIDQKYSHVYNPVTDSWSALPELPLQRSHAEGSTFACDGKIYIVAGQSVGVNNRNSCDRVTTFDPESNSWFEDSVVLKLPEKYEGLSAKIIDSLFIISHGGKGASNYTQKTVFTRVIERNRIDLLVFSSDTVSLDVRAGGEVNGKTWLSSFEGSKSFTLATENGPWLKMIETEGEAVMSGKQINFIANSAGLNKGTYYGYIDASYKPSSSQPEQTVRTVVKLNVVDAGPVLSGLIEAEKVSIIGATVQNLHPGYTGTAFVDYTNLKNDYIEWNLEQATAGLVNVTFRYANGSSADRPLKLTLNGQEIKSKLSFSPTGAWTKWSFVSLPVNLPAGNSKIRLTAIGWSGPNVDHLSWRITSGLLEAEQAQLYQVTVDSKHAEFTGSGFADYQNLSGDYIEWVVDRAVAGTVNLSFRYANGSSGNRPLKLTVNDQTLKASADFPSTRSWTNWGVVSFGANLLQGKNRIRLTAIGSSGPNVDHLKWSETGIASSATVFEEPFEFTLLTLRSYPNPSASTFNLDVQKGNDQPCWLRITDVSGKVIEQRRVFTSGIVTIGVDYNPGLYYVELMQGNRRKVLKLVKSSN